VIQVFDSTRNIFSFARHLIAPGCSQRLSYQAEAGSWILQLHEQGEALAATAPLRLLMWRPNTSIRPNSFLQTWHKTKKRPNKYRYRCWLRQIRRRGRETKQDKTLARSIHRIASCAATTDQAPPPQGRRKMPSGGMGRRGAESDGILAAISRSQVAAHGRDAAAMAKKLLRSTGKAAWIAGTTFLVLVVPLIIEMDREQQLNDLELQQQTLLGAPAK
jgi:mitochondrial import receptor subunit TOM22